MRHDRINAQRLKIALRNGEVRLRSGYPAQDVLATAFQQRRRERIYAMLDRYLREGRTVMELAAEFGCRHQAVSEQIRAGVNMLMKTGWIVETGKTKHPHAALPAEPQPEARRRTG